MIYNTNEYDVKLEIPTANFVYHDLYPHNLENIKEYLNQIKVNDDKTLIILFGGFQCLQERDFWIKPIDEYSRNIPNPVIVFTGKLTSDLEYQIPKIKFVYKRISMFDLVSNLHWNRRVENQLRNWNQDCNRERNYKFYWASSKDWYTRRYILAGLIKKNLEKQNLINYKCVHTDIPGPWIYNNIESIFSRHIDQECQSIEHLIPLPAIDNTVEFMETDVNFYLDSYLGIVTDTYFNNGVFLSEKIFNAINYQQLFFYIGPQGSLKYLRDCGYHTFDDIIDTSYDNIKEHGARLVAARKSLLDFLTQPIEEIEVAYKKNLNSIKHNKQLLEQQKPEVDFTETLRKLINEH